MYMYAPVMLKPGKMSLLIYANPTWFIYMFLSNLLLTILVQCSPNVSI